MLFSLSPIIKGCCVFSLYTVNTILLCLLLFFVAGVKFIIRTQKASDLCTKILIFIATAWISINSLIIRLFNRIEFDVRGLDKLEKRQWYLVLSNHQSWVDILVLQKVLNRKIPMLKFFLKKELIWVPFLGIAWWALDFPFMKRYSKKFIRKHPHLKGKDFEKTRKACEKFIRTPVSVMNFVEGTRFTKAKKSAGNGRYENLLQPKAGGVAFVLGAMNKSLHKIIDVTIVYPGKTPSFWEFISGKTSKIIVDLSILPINDSLAGDFFNDKVFKDNFCSWLNTLWEEKDHKIGSILKESGDFK